MKRYSRDFVRQLRKRSLSVIKGQPQVRREYKLRRQRLYLPTTKVLLVCLVAAYGAFVINVGLNGDRPEFPYIFIALYSSGTIIFRVAVFNFRLQRGTEVAIFAGLPIADPDFFRLQCKSFLLNSSWVFVVTLVAYLSDSVRAVGSFGGAFWPAVLCGLAQWAVVVSLVLALSGFNKPIFRWVAIALYVCIPLAAFLPPEVSRRFAPITTFLPAGWINKAYSLLLANHPTGFLWLLPAIAITATGLVFLPRVRSAFRLYPQENTNDLAGTTEDEAAGREGEKQAIDAARINLGLPAAVSRVSNEILLVPDWNAHGWLERIAGTWLDPEEKIVAEFMTGEQLGRWSSNWLKAFYFSAAAIFVLGLLPAVPLWVGGFAIIAATSLAAPLLGGTWFGFEPIRLGLKVSFVAAFYPVNYWNVSRVILKINIVRLLAWSVFSIPALAVILWRLNIAPQQAALAGFRIAFLGMVVQFPVIVALHSKGTNDTRTFSWRGAVIFTIAIAYIVAAFAALVAFTIPDSPRAWLLGGLILVPVSVLCWWLYGVFYSRGRVDLLHDPK